MAEWSAHRTHNPAKPGLKTALTNTCTWVLFKVALSSNPCKKSRLQITNCFASN